MRLVPAAALLALMCVYASVVPAAETCGTYEGEKTWIEWDQGAQPRGVRVVIRDNRWQFVPNHTHSAVARPSCTGEPIAAALLWLNAAPLPLGNHGALLAEQLGIDNATSVAEWALNPDVAGTLIWSLTMGQHQLQAIDAPVPAALWGLKGRARVLTIPESAYHVIAFAAEESCFSFVGFFAAKDGAKVSTGDL